MLPKSVAEEDRRLLVSVESASEALGRLRWHWTRDESNPDRVTVKEYAFQVGVAARNVRMYARAYELQKIHRYPAFAEALERARMGGETYAATKAVADARGLTVSGARQGHGPEVRRVRERARERAEELGTTVEEEAPVIAERHVRTERALDKAAEERRSLLGEIIEMERHLDAMRRRAIQAIRLAPSIDWGDERTNRLAMIAEDIKALMKVLSSAYDETADVDWDAELARLTPEVAP